MAIGHTGLNGCVIVIVFAVLRSSVSESNVAISGTAQQSSNQDDTRWLAEEAVDGCVQTTIISGCCSHTQAINQKTAWWRVDLGTLVTINAITIYYRDNSQYRLAGYELYVSNATSSPRDGVLCYEDTSTTLAAVQLTITHQCPYVGRYVTVYNYRNTPKRYDWYFDNAVLELCEVQVWGCQVGTHGNGNCDRACSGNCYGGNCNATTGACFYCFTGSYGDFCYKTCPLSCKDNKCEKDSGNCYDCVPKKYGIRCEHNCSMKCLDQLCEKNSRNCSDCIAQKHGVQCEHDCSINCKDRLCDKDTGHCYDCVPQKYGIQCELNCSVSCQDRLCEKETGNCHNCVAGKFGDTCEQDCPSNCQDMLCEKVSGDCTECVAGKFGNTCEQDCPGNCQDMLCEIVSGDCTDCIPHTYGAKCEQNCSANCKDKLCEKETGNCNECVAGKFGDTCDQDCPGNCKDMLCEKVSGDCTECIAGKFGDTCDQDCPGNCKDMLCEKVSGNCTECVAGKFGDTCVLDCPGNCKDMLCEKVSGDCTGCISQTYGTKCEQNCSANCKDKLCEKETGNCNECVAGKFGDTCEQDCPGSCKDMLCEKVSGNCTDCVPQTFGDKCEQNCSANCKDKLCEKETGNCNECDAGKFGDTCEQDCPGNCKNMFCEKVSGDCTDCIPQKYGVKCEQNCSINCKGNLCEKETGNCTECTRGLYGQNCTMSCIDNCTECDLGTGECKECKTRLYGKTCNKTCGHCITCDIDSGSCVSPCDAGYEGTFCRKSKLQDVETTPSIDAGPIAGGVGAFLVVAVVAIVVVIFIRRRQTNGGKQKPYSDVSQHTIYSEPHGTEDQEHQGAQKGRNDPDPDEDPMQSSNVYLNIEQVSRTSGPSDSDYYNHDSVGSFVSRFKLMVEKKLQNKAKAFEDEYKSLPSGALHKHDIGKMEQNTAKNRFKTTFPYDHSRVVLNTVGNDSHSDYINANYIDSVTKTAEYVATQGPRRGTVNDFWRMIWQLETGKIVMLTDLIEGGRPKCDKYWPDEGEPLDTPHFNIILDRERSYAFYIIRDLKVTEKKTKAVRQIHQFHYTSWPDHGTPDPNELIVFHRRVKNYGATLKGKMVVHCSAGIGRTGTFLALDALLEYGKENEHIDVLEYIKTMRKDRVNMVQTADQYIAVHQLLVEAFEMPDTLIPRMKFHVELKVLLNGGAANQTRLRREYQLTQSSKPCYDEENYKAALLTSNKRKNRVLAVLAVDKFRVYLLSHANGRSDYINAVSVPSYTSKTGYIVTQTPLEDTVVDLLTIIMDHNCHTLVIIETNPIDWLPGKDEDMSIGDFKLEYKGESSTIADVDVYDIAIKNVDKSFNTTVRVYHMTGWDGDSSVPKNSSVLLQLMELVDSRRKSDDTKTTVVMCRDGYSQSGLFCCISNARDQMKCDEEVDIYQISRQLLVRRPEFLTNFDQYLYCYNTIKDYLDTTDIYVN